MSISDIVSLKFDSELGCYDEIGRKWALYHNTSSTIQNTKDTQFDFENDNNGTYLNFKRSTDSEVTDITYLNTQGFSFDEFNLMKSLTFEFEIKDLVKKNYQQLLFSTYKGNSDAWGIGIDTNGILKLFISTYSESISLSSIEITKNTWYKYTLSYDDEAMKFYFYINGVLDKITPLIGISQSFISQLTRPYLGNNYIYSVFYIGSNRDWGNRSISSKAFSFKLKSFSMYKGLKYNRGSNNIDLGKFCKLIDENNRDYYKINNFISASNVYSATCFPDEWSNPYKYIDSSKNTIYYSFYNDKKFIDANYLMNTQTTSTSSYSFVVEPFDNMFIFRNNGNVQIPSNYINYHSNYYGVRHDIYSNIYYGYTFYLPPESLDITSKLNFISFNHNNQSLPFYYNADSKTNTFNVYNDSSANSTPIKEIIYNNTNGLKLYVSVIDNILKFYINGELIIELNYKFSNSIYYFLLNNSNRSVKINNNSYSAIHGFLYKDFFFFRTLYKYDGLMDYNIYRRLISEAKILNVDNKIVVNNKIIYSKYKWVKLNSKLITNHRDNKFNMHIPFMTDSILNKNKNDIMDYKKESVTITPTLIYYQKQYEQKHSWFIVGIGDILDEDLYLLNENNNVVKVYRKGQKNSFDHFQYMDNVNHKMLFYKYRNIVSPLPTYDMQRGYLDVEIDERSCKNPNFKIRCHEHDTGCMVGDYHLVDHPSGDSYIAYVPNLDMSKTYDITLIDTKGKIEYQVMSNRKPILIT